MRNDELVSSVVCMLAVDGVIDQLEVDFLKKLCRQTNVPRDVVNDALEKAKTGRGKVFIPKEPDEKKLLFTFLLKAAAANYEIVPEERRMLDKVAVRMGIPEAAVEKAVAKAVAQIEAMGNIDPTENRPVMRTARSKPDPPEPPDLALALESDVAEELVPAETTPDLDLMVCPKCGYEQEESPKCEMCGIYIEKYLQIQQRERENAFDRRRENPDAPPGFEEQPSDPIETERWDTISNIEGTAVRIYQFAGAISVLCLLGRVSFMTPLILLVLGFALQTLHSRVASVLTFLFSLQLLISWLFSAFSGGLFSLLSFSIFIGLSKIGLAALLVAASYLTIGWTFKLHGKLADPKEMKPWWGNLLTAGLVLGAVCYLFFFSLLSFFLLGSSSSTAVSTPMEVGEGWYLPDFQEGEIYSLKVMENQKVSLPFSGETPDYLLLKILRVEEDNICYRTYLNGFDDRPYTVPAGLDFSGDTIGNFGEDYPIYYKGCIDRELMMSAFGGNELELFHRDYVSAYDLSIVEEYSGE